MAEKDYPFEIKWLIQNLEKLFENAELGNYEANQRLDAIKKLANPIFDFALSDYQRILDKKLPIQVGKGMRLYKMMNQLKYLVQPVGKRKGTACSVRRVDYENLAWEEFLELRGTFSAGFISEAMKQRAKPNFNGLDVLNEEQKELSQRIKVYFGNKKKPTLQSLAMNLLCEDTDGKDFSERSLYFYLEAVRKHKKRREKAAGFDVMYFTFHSVMAFNLDKRTIREALEQWDKILADFQGMQQEISANLMKNIMPQLTENLTFLFQFPQFSDLFRSITPNLSNLISLSQKKDSP